MKSAWGFYLLYVLVCVYTVWSVPGVRGSADLEYSNSSSTSLPYIQTTAANSTGGDNTTYPQYVGFIMAGIAVVFFGSNFVPVKKFETGDGMFFQWVMCAGVWLTGLILQIVRKSQFHPYSMLGGVIWATGNICVVPIIKTIGMGLGLCIWGMFNLVAGWASGRFGMFGLTPEPPNHNGLNYAGVALAVASTVIYVFVKNEVTPPNVELSVQVDQGERSPLLESRSNLYGDNPQDDVLIFNKKRSNSVNSNLTDPNTAGDDHMFIDKLSPGLKRIVGIGLSVFSGILYGINFFPSIYIQDHRDKKYSQYYGASANSLDYVFGQYCGIYMASSFYFIIYLIYMKNKPKLYPQVILPALASGVMWGFACGCWFIANSALSEPVAFPIITTGPGAIASLFWGVCIFKEIRGKRNILILLLAFTVTVSGVVLVALSKL